MDTPAWLSQEPAADAGEERDALTRVLAAAGCVAAAEEADELIAAAADDHERLRVLVERRRAGEPLAWVTGSVRFCGVTVLVHPGVYVPRWQSEELVLAAAEALPEGGTAVDLCTGSGALALALGGLRPSARVVGTEDDPAALACARANGVTVFEGDLAAGLPADLAGTVDVVLGVVPYVPTAALRLLPRDSADHEPRHALDGGPQGIEVLLGAAQAAAWLLRPAGHLLLELGAGQDDELRGQLRRFGFEPPVPLHDAEGDLRGIVCRRRADRGPG